jgi:hypothetical protein
MRAKIDILREYMACGDWYAALRLAASWPDAVPEVRKAWEGCARPDFQRQLGRDPEALVEAGKAALKTRYRCNS